HTRLRFHGPGWPSAKRGTKVMFRSSVLTDHLKAMIASFGFYFYDAPGEAEAELAKLNECGGIDGIITEDSDTLVFGAPSVQHQSLICTSDSIENPNGVSLDKDGIFLFALLLGGNYHPGVSEVGTIIAHALAKQGFGQKLVTLLRFFDGLELTSRLGVWRNSLHHELRTNSSGHLGKHHPKLADEIPDTFPDLRVAQLYLHLLMSKSPCYTGPVPNVKGWNPKEPYILELAAFFSAQFGWNGEELLKKFNSNLWPASFSKIMISSVTSFKLQSILWSLMKC
ncbi:hypothetical protein B0H17DRAFT_957288, partial [Mycena rosella]